MSTRDQRRDRDDAPDGAHAPPPPVPPEALHDRPEDWTRADLDERATELVEGGLGIARLALGGWWRTSRWGLSTSREIAERVVGSLASGESLTHVAGEAATGARDALLELAGYGDGPSEEPTRRRRDDDQPGLDELRRRGAELLRRSADVNDPLDTHPAYARILESLSPDEARILRLLHLDGPQPSVDVRSASVLPNDSELVQAGLTMIGGLAGCRYVERTDQYLNNLTRLGLVWLSHEALRDPDAYQVLEAQPNVDAAMQRAKRARTVRRSIRLTPFGHDFVTTCLTPEDDPPADAAPSD